MTGALRSLIIPGILSAVSFAATIFWFGRLEKQVTVGATVGDPIAFLKTGNDKIERRSKSRIMWQAVGEGTPFFAGDAVRTLPRAEGSVQLIKGSMVVTLEPDSLIVLEDNKGALELNLVSGSLLVESKKSSGKDDLSKGAAPVIRAGNTKVELGGKDAQLSLSKTANAEASIAVTKGDIELKSGNNTVKVSEGKVSTLSADGKVKTEASIETTGPAPGEVLVINRLPEKRATFSWKPLDKGSKIHFEAGPSRTELKPTGLVADGSAGQLAWQIPVGPFFWRLVLRDATGKQLSASIALRAEGLFISPPVLLAPSASETLVIKPKSRAVSLSWQTPPKAIGIRLQVATDKEFKSNLVNKAFTEEQELTIDVPGEGVYYWRVLGQWEGFKAAVSSEVRSFEARNVQNLTPPKLAQPALNASFNERAMKTTGFFADWEKIPGASGYRIQILEESEVLSDEKLNVSQFRVSGLKPGKYKWRVMATSDDGNDSKWSPARAFSVNKLAEIRWMNPFEEEFLYETAQARVDLKWQNASKGAVAWQVRHARNPSELGSAKWLDSAKPAVSIPLETPGVWYFEAQALSATGEQIAATKPLRLSVKPKPELDPPAFASNKKTFNAKPDGSLPIKWQSVSGATGYALQIKDTESGKVKEYLSSSTDYTVKDLMPGKYEVKLRTINAFDKPGQFGEPRSIVVPQTSDAPPPTIGNFNVH